MQGRCCVSAREPRRDGRWGADLVLLKTVLKDVLNDQATSFAKGDIVPHPTKCLIDVLHDLRRRISPSQLEEFLPDVAGVAMNDGLGYTTQQLMDHDGLEFFRDGIECFLDHVTAKGVHAQAQCVATDGISNGNDLLWGAVLEATLDQEVAKAVDHQRVGLCDNGFDDLIFLFYSADFEFLLQEDGCLLVIVADDLVNDILPVAGHASIKKASIVEWLHWLHVHRARRIGGLLKDRVSEEFLVKVLSIGQSRTYNGVPWIARGLICTELGSSR